MSVVDLRARRPGFGVDRLSMSFPLAVAPDAARFLVPGAKAPRVQQSLRPDGESDRTLSVNVPLTTKTLDDGRSVETSSVFVGATLVGGRWWGKVESNPARIGDPEGCSLLQLDDLADVGSLMFDVAATILRPAEDVDSARVKRVDLARDFRDVRNPSGYVWALLNVKRPYAKRQFVYSDPNRNRAQTLFAGSGAGGVRLYDQFEAYAEKGAPQGALRWEVECREDWIGKGARSCAVNFGSLVGSEGVSRLVSLAESRWEWSGMGNEVTSTSDVVSKVAAVVAAGGYPDGDRWVKVTPAVARGFLGQLLMDVQGLDMRSSKTQQSQHHKLQKYLGVVVTPELFVERDSAPVGRLDWSTGTEIAAAA